MSNLKLWLNVLKSGKYRVNTNNISLKRADGSFSIPGIAADLYIKLTKKSSWDHYRSFTETGNDCDLPIPVIKWLGIEKLRSTFETMALMKGSVKEVTKQVEDILKQEGYLK
jgi:hypothetical protein